jgi:CubicO group peptidase (beta-lactamase class C family)
MATRAATTKPDLEGWVREHAREHDVPGLAVGVLVDGEESYVVHGVTSVENPLPVDEHTLFQFGSTGKTFTATALMRLQEQGRIDLGTPVRTYVPELELQNEEVARRVTVLQLLNHTAGWEGDLLEPTGDGDDALARYVGLMAGVQQMTPPGEVPSYNNASLSLAGRVIEHVTGQTYEQAMRELVFEALGLTSCQYFPNDLMTRRFVVGHQRHQDGTITVARPWALPRGGNPAGGISSDIRDQIAYARFHLGDGRAKDGTRILSPDALARMQRSTVDVRGSSLGDAIGITWMLRDADGVRIVSHGGTTNGQHSMFEMVPERGFAIASLTNCGPNGPHFNDQLLRWALKEYLGVVEPVPEPISVPSDQLAPYAARYETIAMFMDVTVKDDRLLAKPQVKPEIAAKIGLEMPDQPPDPLGMLEGPGDRFVVSDGPEKGRRGRFIRNPDGTIAGIHYGGRYALRAT